ncbi:ferredoxin--NADP reductase [Mycolicibacterium sp. lyk4-40-TYG-92]|uniref:ferredoxin--NADP reductase n=1 Tax=Mycolicibacterium sp. lyk4-40-TYG-92 TaxID=3040295 RepID=UPI00254E19C6|nr:ferredoxin--NADP reductase [Mycolicibacterium sp. lyk4-40-TYG-92]
MTASTASRSHELTVVEVITETPDAVSLVLAAAHDAREHFTYQAGQFLTLRIPATDGAVSRCYSLSSSPSADEHLKVTVKRTSGGLASNWLCDHATAGMTLESLTPAGAFTVRPAESELIFVAAGSGITPVISMIRAVLLQSGRRVTLVYANRDRESVIFAAELTELLAAHDDRLTVAHWLESESGLPTPAALRTLLPAAPGAETAAYLCGPAAFMDVAAAALHNAGVAREHVHREVFVSLATDAFAAPEPAAGNASAADSATATVEIDGDTHEISWPRGEVLLDALLNQGIDAPYACREGNCGACAYTLRQGEVSMRVNDTLDDYELGIGVRLACQSLPESDRLTAVFDR